MFCHQSSKQRGLGLIEINLETMQHFKDAGYRMGESEKTTISFAGGNIPTILPIRGNAETESGDKVAVQSTIVFGAQTYRLYVVAKDRLEADRLSDILYAIDEFTFAKPR